MKFIITSFAVIGITCNSFAQIKTISYQELPSASGAPTGSGIFFGATMTTTDITVTFAGPSNKWIALGFGTMMSPTDVLIYSGGKFGATHPVAWEDYYNSGSTAAGVNKDVTNNWTINSDNVVSGLRTVNATRPLSTGDGSDVSFSFAANSINLVWATDGGASYTITYHGTSNRGMNISLPWTLADVTPPALATTGALSPSDNATGVSLGTNLVMTFNENVTLGTGNISLYQSGGTLVEAFNVASSPNVSVSGAIVTINPTNLLNSLTNYYIQVDATAIKDVPGNSYAGISDNTTWNFTTLDNTGDVTPPGLAVGPFLPADNSTAVPISSALQVTFNEDVVLGTSGTIGLYLSTGTLVETFNVASSTQLTVAGPVLTITPSSALNYSTSYYVNIDNAAISDVALNAFPGFSDNSTWNFTTELNTAGITNATISDYLQVSEKQLYVNLQEGTYFSVNVYDMRGRLVASKNNQSHIDLSKEKAGVYVVNILVGEQQLQTKIVLE